MPVELAIFDLDGTLIDSIGDLADAMNAVLELLGHPAHPRESYRFFVGDGIEMLVVNFYGDTTNTGGPLYVKINDEKVTYPDSADLTAAQWHQWIIDLTQLGTDLSAVTSLNIGIDGVGSGWIYVDDIALYRDTPDPIEPDAGQ